MSGIFISYRREDSAFVSGLIHERLVEHFGSDAIFTDVDSIPLGVNFKKYIDEQVGKCDIFLAVIGEKWLSVTDVEGRPRIENPEDFVRLEMESALKREIPMIPLLVEGIAIPSADKLPESLKELAFRNGTSIRSKPTLDSDVERLIRGIEKHLGVQVNAGADRVGDEAPTQAESLDTAAPQATSLTAPAEVGRTERETPAAKGRPSFEQDGRRRRMWMIGAPVALLLAVALASSYVWLREPPPTSVPTGQDESRDDSATPTESPVASEPPTSPARENEVLCGRTVGEDGREVRRLLGTNFEDLHVFRPNRIDPFKHWDRGRAMKTSKPEEGLTRWQPTRVAHSGEFGLSPTPNGNPGIEHHGDINSVVLPNRFDVDGAEEILLYFYMNSTSNPRVRAEHNCDSSLNVYYKFDDRPWAHKTALCGRHKTESSGWTTRSFSFPTSLVSTVQFGFVYGLQNNPEPDPEAHFVIDDLEVCVIR